MDDRELMMKCRKEVANPSSILEKFRAKVILKCGCSGIKTLGRLFRNMDDDGNRMLSIDELHYGLQDKGIEMNEDELKDLFAKFDMDGSGSINFDEFLIKIRGPMTECRLKLVMAAFRIMDVTGDEVITVEDMKGKYNAIHHPKYKSGEWTEKQCLEKWLETFDTRGHADGQVTEEEWVNYYYGVSASVDSDAYFDLMMRQAWGLKDIKEYEGKKGKKGHCANHHSK